MKYTVVIAFSILIYKSRLQANGSGIIYKKDWFLRFTLGLLLLPEQISVLQKHCTISSVFCGDNSSKVPINRFKRWVPKTISISWGQVLHHQFHNRQKVLSFFRAFKSSTWFHIITFYLFLTTTTNDRARSMLFYSFIFSNRSHFIHKPDKVLRKISVFLQACCIYQSVLQTNFPTESHILNQITFLFPCTQKLLLHTRPYALKTLPKVISVPHMHCSLHKRNFRKSLKMPSKWYDRMSLKTLRINMSKAPLKEDHLHLEGCQFPTPQQG